MRIQTTISNEEWNAFKERAIKEQPIRKKIQIKDLKFMSLDHVEYAGLIFGLTKPALKNLLKFIGLNTTSINNMKDTMGDKFAHALLNAIKNALASSSTKDTIVITVSPKDKMIHDISQNSGGGISALTYFDTVDKLINRYDLNVVDVNNNSANGNISIKTIGESQFGVKGFKNEIFKTGLDFSKTVSSFDANPYNMRLICTNGMVTRGFEEQFSVHNLSEKSWEAFYIHLDRIEKAGFVPQKFEEQILKANKTLSSLAELEYSVNLITGSSKSESLPRDIESFIPVKETYSGLYKAGIDPLKLSNEQKKNLRTNVTIWDVVNGITDFASHDYGYSVHDNQVNYLQMQAGNLLAKKSFDTGNLILNQPF